MTKEKADEIATDLREVLRKHNVHLRAYREFGESRIAILSGASDPESEDAFSYDSGFASSKEIG